MRVLYVTTLSGTMNFFSSHIEMLKNNGCVVELACHCTRPMAEILPQFGCKMHEIPFLRFPLSMKNIEAYTQLKRLIYDGQYDIVHCHTPIAAVCTRLACRKLRKNGLKVIYTAHGFHFFSRAPIKNWLIYYPVEWICAHWTDVLITINHEDYDRAKKHMHAGKVEYVPGVGVDIDRFRNTIIDRVAKRKEVGVPCNAIVLLSVGELTKNKNHETIIKAMSRLNDPAIHYLVAGHGPLERHLNDIATELGLEKNVHVLGFRKDIEELTQISDIFCFPSYREGLGISALEAMASSLPLITSNVHGINDYSINDVTGLKTYPNDVDGFSKAICKLATDSILRQKMGKFNLKAVENFGMKTAVDVMHDIYKRAGVN